MAIVCHYYYCCTFNYDVFMKTETMPAVFIAKSQKIEANGCTAIAFRRPLTGSNDVSVHGIPLEAGEAISFSQNVGDNDFTFYEIVFTAGANENQLFCTKIMTIG